MVVMAVNSSLLGMYGIRSTQKYYGRLTSRLAVQNIESTRLRSRRRGVVVMMAGVHTAAWWVCMAYVLRRNTAVVLQHISVKFIRIQFPAVPSRLRRNTPPAVTSSLEESPCSPESRIQMRSRRRGVVVMMAVEQQLGYVWHMVCAENTAVA